MTKSTLAGLPHVQEITYELRVEQVMTSQIIPVTPEDTMQYVKDLMREHRISGAPVVSPASGALVGVVSVEDVIKSADAGALRSPVGEWMSRSVVTVSPKEPVAEAIKKFAKHKFGRFPVVDGDQLVGILTPGDVLTRALSAMERRHREEAGKRPTRRVFQEISADDALLKMGYLVASRDFERAGNAATRLRRGLLLMGLDGEVIRRAAVAAYEAEMNIVIHSVGGRLIGYLRPKQFVIRATDGGPGIPDLRKALEPGFTTAPDWIRELGFGAGMGLNNIKSCADSFRIESRIGVGTRVEATFRLASE